MDPLNSVQPTEEPRRSFSERRLGLSVFHIFTSYPNLFVLNSEDQLYFLLVVHQTLLAQLAIPSALCDSVAVIEMLA
jgi:hypothetical protein